MSEVPSVSSTTETGFCSTPASNAEAAAPAGAGGQLIDGVALWAAEAGGADPHSMVAIRVDENERLLIFFTTSVVRVHLHYMEMQSVRGYRHCGGADCLLCRIGRATETRDLVPAFDVLERAVGVLPVSPSLRANALRPQLQPILRRVGNGEPVFLTIVKKNGMNFVVSTSPLPERADDGAAVIANFQEAINSGKLDLASAFPKIDNATLQEIPEVAKAMAAKGIEPC